MQGMTIKAALFKLRAFIALIFIFSFFAFTSDAFLSSTNLIILTKHVAINAILAIGMTFISLLFYTFKTLLVFCLFYMVSVPISFFMYKNRNKKELSETSEDEHEDVL